MHVFYVGGRSDGCYYVRCMLPMRANGWDGDWVSLRSKAKSPEMAANAAMRADVVVFQRPDDPKKLQVARMLKAEGKKIVFDNDDTYIPDSGIPTQLEQVYEKKILERMNSNLYAFIKEADLVTTTTDFLRREYEQFNPNVAVLPNTIDPTDWYTPKRNETDKVRIGFVGSVATAQDYEVIRELIEELSDREDVEIVLYAIPPDTEDRKMIRTAWKKEIAFWNTVTAEWHTPSRVKDYMYDLNNLKLDMMLIPRLDSYFNRCKSNIKFLEASMCEIPVIAQSFDDKGSPYDGDSELMLANTQDEWRNAVYTLIEDKGKRRELGKRAKAYVEKNYNINTRKYEWRDAYQKLLF